MLGHGAISARSTRVAVNDPHGPRRGVMRLRGFDLTREAPNATGQFVGGGGHSAKTVPQVKAGERSRGGTSVAELASRSPRRYKPLPPSASASPSTTSLTYPLLPPSFSTLASGVAICTEARDLKEEMGEQLKCGTSFRGIVALSPVWSGQGECNGYLRAAPTYPSPQSPQGPSFAACSFFHLLFYPRFLTQWPLTRTRRRGAILQPPARRTSVREQEVTVPVGAAATEPWLMACWGCQSPPIQLPHYALV